jgi:hypothetical protein
MAVGDGFGFAGEAEGCSPSAVPLAKINIEIRGKTSRSTRRMREFET